MLPKECKKIARGRPVRLLTPVWATKSLLFLKLHANPYAFSTETGRGQKRVTPYTEAPRPTKSRVSLTSAPTSVVYSLGLLIASWSRLAVISSRRLAFACPCVSVAVGMAPGGTAGAGAGNGAAGNGAAGVGAAGVGAVAGVSAARRRVSYRWVGAGAGAGASAITASPSLSGGADATGTEAICSSDSRKTQPARGATIRTCLPLSAVTSTDVP